MTILERQNRRLRMAAKRTEHVAHAEKGLVNDAIVVAIEWRFDFRVAMSADVQRAAEKPSSPYAFQTEGVYIIAPFIQ